ncbi:MAG: ribulose-phosphate 3-epimerase [Clostridiales bacterium]|nr:ribulose-phosphate 3-epimerase [Clostridiales bacterium]
MVEVSTSILNVDKKQIIKVIYDLEIAKTDYFHIDVMDGIFVKEDTSDKMMEYCDYLNNIVNIPLDVHLMVKDVKKYIDMFLPYNPNIITIHYESFSSKEDILKTIEYIKNNNCKVGLAVKPSTNIKDIEDILKYINLILVMTVEPGKGGQKILSDTLVKIKEVYEYIKINQLDVLIQADGGINIANVEEIKEYGVDIIVSGTAIIESQNYSEIIKKMKK